MRMKLIAAATVAGVLGFVVLGAAPASAATIQPVAAVQAAATPDFTPSASGIRKYYINVMGKVLGKAMPKGWQAEQIANQYQYNGSWESLETAVYGTPAWDPKSPPDSYSDYVLQQTSNDFKPASQAQYKELMGDPETRSPGKGGTGGKPYSIPATKVSPLMKTLGGAATAISGYEFGTSLGQGIDSMLGIDANGLVCSQSDGAVKTLESVVTGADCASFDNALSAEVRNVDVAGGFSMAPITVGNFTVDAITNVAQTVLSDAPNTHVTLACFSGKGAPTSSFVSSGITMLYKKSSGGNVAVGVDPLTYQNGHYYKTSTSYYVGDPCMAFSASVSTGFEPQCLLPTSVQGSGGTCASAQASAVTANDPDPSRVFTCSVTGSDGAVYSASSDAFKESDDTEAPPECPVLPDGVTAQHVKVSEDGGGKSNTLQDQDTTDAYREQTTTFPGCAQGECAQVLNKKQADGTWVDCATLGTTCIDWFTDPNKTTDYECTLGGDEVELANCNLYSGIYDPARIAAGAPYSDPTTGQWSGGQNGPDESEQAFSTKVQDPDAPRTCTAEKVTGFDPVAWVMRPVQCAMEWAFVPGPTKVKVDMESASIAWKDTLPGELKDKLDEEAPEGEAEGCELTVDLPMPPLLGGTQHIQLLSACDGIWAEVAGWTRALIGAAAIVGCFFAVRRAISGSVGYSGD